jgi:hypothetical protein
MIKFESNLKGMNVLTIDGQQFFISDNDTDGLVKDLKKTGYI